MDLYDQLREAWGQAVIIPLAQYIRYSLEGEDAPRTPLAEERFLEPKNTPVIDPVSIGAAVAIGLIFTVLEPIIRKLIARATKSFKLVKTDETRLTESSWQLLFYTFIWIYCCVIVSNVEWYSKTYLCWEPPFPNQEIGTMVWVLYVTQIGWYAHCIFTHVTSDVRKSDFWIMLIHHISALLLLYSALATGYHRCGVLTMYCLDGCDIFLHLTKCVRLIGNTHYVPTIFAVGSYLSVVFSWVYFRIVLFLQKVLYTASFQGLHYGGWKNSDNWFYYNTLLLIIYALQIYWFYLILLSGYKYVRFGDKLDDQRDPTADPNDKKKN